MQERLSRFQGASAISSADFYGNGEGGGRPSRTGSATEFDLNANELMSKLSFQVKRPSLAMSSDIGRCC
jgi:hypothetical protein